MVRHIVFFKLEDNSDAHRNQIKERFMGMVGNIEGMYNLDVGLNFSTEERAFDMALSCDFDDRAGLAHYATHPVHVAIVTYLKSINTVTKVVDYEF